MLQTARLKVQGPRYTVPIMPASSLSAGLGAALAQRFCLSYSATSNKRHTFPQSSTASAPPVSKKRRGVESCQETPEEGPVQDPDADDSVVGLATETTEEHLARHQGKEWQKRCARCRRLVTSVTHIIEYTIYLLVTIQLKQRCKIVQ